MSDNSRRDFVKKAMYVTPVILTLAVAPEFAKAGSGGGGGPPPGPPAGPPPGPPRGR